MRISFFMLGMVFALGLAWYSAQQQLKRPMDLEAMRLGMTVTELNEAFGAPSDKYRNQLTYIFGDSSELTVTLRDGKVSNARLKFHRRLEIEDPKLRQLTLVQMDAEVSEGPSWFFAGKPEEGLIYKITGEGVIESLTWVPPFTYASNQPKRLQALYREFQGRKSSKL